MASFVPMAVLLGPMVMIFMSVRAPRSAGGLERASGNAGGSGRHGAAGSGSQCDAERPRAAVAYRTRPNRKVPDIVSTLTEYRDKNLKPSDLSNQPWEVQRMPPEQLRKQKLDDLAQYLQERSPHPRDLARRRAPKMSPAPGR